MTDSTKSVHDSKTEDTIREALASVERLERERAARAPDDIDLDAVEVLKASDLPPSGDPAGSAGAQDDEEGIVLEEDAAPAAPAAGDAMLAAMIQAKNEAVAALEQTQKEAKQLHERLVRSTADFENFKKRQMRERSDAVKFANEGILKELLPVIDNLERAVNAARQSADEASPVGPLLSGVEMVQRQFADALGKFGVVGFSALGERFDPARHEAVAQREDASVPSSTVIEEYQLGYLLHDRLVRPSMVVVSTGGPAPAPLGQGAPDEN